LVGGWRLYQILQGESPAAPPTVQPPSARQILEQEAAAAWKEMNSKVTDLLVAGRFGEALDVLKSWPAEKFADTASDKDRLQVRAKLMERVSQDWKEADRQAKLLLDGQHFEEALALYSKAVASYNGIIEFEDEARRSLREATTRKEQYEAEQKAARLASERAFRQRFASQVASIDALLVNAQFEQAMLDFYDIERTLEPEFADLTGQLRSEIEGLVKLKRKVIEQIRGNPYAEFELSIGTGKVKGALADADLIGIEIRQTLDGGVIKMKRVPWADLAPADVLRVLCYYVNDGDYDAKWALAGLMTRYAAHGKIPVPDVRTWLEKLREMDPSRAGEVDPFMVRLDD
jgi:hypothetical protein